MRRGEYKIRIEAISNGRSYGASATPELEIIEHNRKKHCAYVVLPEEEHGLNYWPNRIRVVVASNDLHLNSDLNEGPKFVREGKFEAPFDFVLEICLRAIEEREIELPKELAERFLAVAKNLKRKAE